MGEEEVVGALLHISLLIQCNHTNIYAQVVIKILKDSIFGKVKACNLIQMFYFVVEKLEREVRTLLRAEADKHCKQQIGIIHCR